MALRAIFPKLRLVNIGMAVSALLSHVGEYRLGMALRAGHTLVHATKRKSRLIVIKLGHAADGLPSTEGMAILTRNIKRPVRAARDGGRLPLCPPRHRSEKQDTPQRQS